MPYQLVTSDLIAPDYQVQDQDGNVIAVFVCPMSRPEIDGKTVLDAAKLFVNIANLVERQKARKLNESNQSTMAR